LVPTLAAAALLRRPLRSALTALGIAIAIASTVIFLSLGEGMRQAFVQELSGVGPDLQISFGDFTTNQFGGTPEPPISYEAELLAAADRYGISAVMPLLIHDRSGLTPTSAVVFQGLPAGVDVAEIYLDFRLIDGRPLNQDDEGSYRAVVGALIAERNEVAVGDTYRLNPRASFEVVGIVSAAGGLLDGTILVPIDTLQAAIGTEDRVSFLVAQLNDPTRAAKVAVQISEDFPELGVQTRAEFLDIVERGIAVANVVQLGISAIALIVGAIAVINTMLMSVFERTREFGVVRAVGARPRFLFGLVLLEAVVLSLLGAVVGVALGVFGAWGVNLLALHLIDITVAAVTPRLVLFAVALAAVMGLLAGIVPAARAARVPIAVAVARE
jgi:putative ABC transport system permease protein